MAPIPQHRFFSSLRIAIVFSGSLLLAIWSLKNSIALRNFLLAFGALMALSIFTYQAKLECFNLGRLRTRIFRNQLYQYAPLIFSIMLFAWVIDHLIFLSVETSLQLQELKGTWLRAALALITGSAIGLVLQNRLRLTNFLWLGIFCSFLYLLAHYLNVLLESQTIFMVDYYFSSPFGNKINTVLMGGLFIGAACGSSAYAICYEKNQPWFFHLFWRSGGALVIFSYTQIIDTRNGIGIALILIFIWFIYIVFKKTLQTHALKPLSLMIIPLLIVGFFIQEHLSLNRGWNHFLSDIEIGIQIDNIPNWQDVKKFGYPNTKEGEQVYPNNYERVAWATAGVYTLQGNPLGFGLLEHSLGYLVKKQYPDANVMSSHSGWIDFGLAFGIPGLILILGALASIILLAAQSHSIHALTAIWISTSLLLIFTVAETSSKHSIEILLFFIGLLTLLIAKKSEVNK